MCDECDAPTVDLCICEDARIVEERSFDEFMEARKEKWEIMAQWSYEGSSI